MEDEFKTFKQEVAQKEINVDAEINESLHGLAHLQASDEELRALLRDINV